jgi:hypothetical protein
MSKARDLANAGTALTTVSATELGYLDGVTSAVQTQIDSKIGSASAINPTIVDAKGDIIAASAADTVARLAVGANDTVLTADSTAATGLKWATPAAGGMTQIATGTLSGTSVSITSIPSTYEDLVLYIYGFTASTNSLIGLRFNNNSTSNYSATYIPGTNAPNGTYADTYIRSLLSAQDFTTSNQRFMVQTRIFNYAEANNSKLCSFYSADQTNFAGNPRFGAGGYGGSTALGAITSIQIITNGASFTGGTYEVWGVK